MSESKEAQRARASKEAAQWLEWLERTITGAEGRALRKWLKSALHREVIVAHCKLWHGPEILSVLGVLIPVEAFHEETERYYGRITLALCLGVTGIATASVLFGMSRVWSGTARQDALLAEGTYVTTVDERTTIALPDGSAMTLNTGTNARLSYGLHSREITIVQGEAAFDVAEDPRRPFSVFVGPRRLTVDTGIARLNVRRVTPEETELTVLTGAVTVPPSRSVAPLTPALVRAQVHHGEQTFHAAEGGTIGAGWQLPSLLLPADIDRRLEWQRQPN